MKKITILLVAASFCMQLCACQANPSSAVVVSKNDGTFNKKLSKTVQSWENGYEKVQYIDNFFSTDRSIEYTLDIDQALNVSIMPVVEIVPHKFLTEDVKRVANVLFDEGTFYEREPSKDPNFSKMQIQKAIARWSKYTNSVSMKRLIMDSSEENIADQIDLLQDYITQYTEKLDNAPVENTHVPCEWTFRKDSYYNNLEAEIGGRLLVDEPDVIYSTVEMSDIEYIFTSSTHDRAAYKLNTIDVTLSSGIGPAEMDMKIYRAMLCRVPQPSEEQILSISNKAQNMLDTMQLGDWIVTDSYVETRDFEGISEHVIVVEATPAFFGIAAIYGQETPSATAADIYSAFYPISRAEFGFSPNGELIYFRMQSPIDIKKVINSNVETIPLDEMMENAKNDLILRDAHTGYGIPSDMIYLYEDVMNEALSCKIEINKLNVGLARIDVANSESYYYVPAIAFSGNANYYGKDTGNLYVCSTDYTDGNINLLWLNAVDGSIIS